jgi:shikimate dehydrogenase
LSALSEPASARLEPALHETAADRLGLRYVYQVIDLDELELNASAIGELSRTRSARLPRPQRHAPVQATRARVARRSRAGAVALGAVNTVVFDGGQSTGHNTDVYGFRESFVRSLPDAPLDAVVLVGAGGAGAAVAHALMELGTRVLTIIDLDQQRASDLAAAVNARFSEGDVSAAPSEELGDRLSDACGLVHATPMGMAAHPGTAIAPSFLRRDLWVADIVYRPLETELLRDARVAGCRTLDGGGMAVFQAVESFRLFTGAEPDPEHMLRQFAELVAADASLAPAS